MTDEPTSPPDLANLEMDLAKSFQPSWARESDAPDRISRMVAKHGDDDRPERPGKSRDRGPGRDRPPARSGGGNRRDDRKGERRSERFEPRRPERPPRPAPELGGWTVQFQPHRLGVEGLAKQIKAGAKAYPLFDLARLVLEKSERYLVDFQRTAENSPALYQLRADGSIWLTEGEAVAQALARHLDKFYRRESVTTDPPKGAFSSIAVCGLSGELLGPSNYHDYPNKLRRLHAERFAHMPFETYKGRVRMEKDEELIAKWKEEQSRKDEFYPAETPEGVEPVKLATLAEVERHFREHHAAAEIVPVRDRVKVPGPSAMNESSPPIHQLARRVWDELQRFPLPLAQLIGQQLTSQGLQIFKTHENITYISLARPRYLDRVATPVSETLGAMLEYLEAHPTLPRPEQWKALVALRPPAAEGAESQRESAVAADLAWLLHEGHVLDFAGRGLQAARRPQARQPRQPEQ